MDPSVAKSLYETPIEKFITRDVEVVRLNDPVTLAVEKYKSSPDRAVLIEDHNGRLAGMITDDDLTKLLGANPNSTVETIATTDIIAIKKDAQLGQLLSVMNANDASPVARQVVPVVDEQQHPVGVVFRDHLRGDIAESMLEKART